MTAGTTRVVVTGLGTVNPLARTVPDYWRALLAGKSGVSPLTRFDVSAFKTRFGGEVKDFNPEPVLDARSARRLDRFAQFAMVAAHEAVKDSGIDFSRLDPFRSGCIIGSGIGGLAEFEDGVLRCAPALGQAPAARLVAHVSLAYNIGVGGYCRSTVARRQNAGDVGGACDAFLMWNRAGGVTWPGLTRRREAERKLCREGL